MNWAGVLTSLARRVLRSGSEVGVDVDMVLARIEVEIEVEVDAGDRGLERVRVRPGP